jgi:hypothetical protein
MDALADFLLASGARPLEILSQSADSVAEPVRLI